MPRSKHSDPETQAKQPEFLMGPHGRIYLQWQYSDGVQHERGRLWYIIAILAGLGLLIYALSSANFLFALIIVMFALVIYVSSVSEPAPIAFAITEEGIEIGSVFHPYRDVDKFWFYYEPPFAANLYITTKGLLGSRLTVDLKDQDPNIVRKYLGSFVQEDLDQVDEPLSDTLSRILKI
ncbi:MAG: hypothetical protein WCT10_05425 [Patescibacteria group bacterium]|jgi:hypothetical protein